MKLVPNLSGRSGLASSHGPSASDQLDRVPVSASPEPSADPTNETRKHSSPSRPRKRRPYVRNSLRIFFGLLLLLIVIMIFNALQMNSRQLQVAAVDIDGVDDEAVAQSLLEILAQPSVSYSDRDEMDPEPFKEIHQILRTRFPLVHNTLECETVNELSLLYCWQGSDPSLDPILLMSHLDVVPIDPESRDQWTDQQGNARIDDKFVWGRGALDVKCGVISILAAVEYLLSNDFKPERTVYIAMGHDEEVGGHFGNGAIAKRFGESGTRFDFILDEGGAIPQGIIPGITTPVAFVAIAEKTCVEFTVTALGEGGHGSMPGRSAILNLAECITRIEDQPMPTRMTDVTATLFDFLGPEMPLHQRTIVANRRLFDPLLTYKFAQQPSTNAVVRTTINVTQVSSSSHANQNATEARATINARLLPGETAEDVRDHILGICADLKTHDPITHDSIPAIQCESDHRPIQQLVSPVDCEPFQQLQKTIHQIFPDVKVAAGLTSVSTDSAWYFDVSDHVYRFIPMRVDSRDVARIHGIDERIGRENLGEIVRFYVQLLKNTVD